MSRAALVLLFLFAPLFTLSAPTEARASEGEVRNPGEDFSRALRRAERGDTASAVRILRELTELDPDWSDVFLNLGIIAEYREDWTLCLTSMRRYLYLEPSGAMDERARSTMANCEANLPESGWLRVTQRSASGGTLAIDGLVTHALPHEEPILLPAGAVALNARRVDHDPRTVEVTIEPGETTEVDLTLEAHPQYGQLVISASHEGATVTIDGREIGQTGSLEPERLRVGAYLVVVRKENFHPWQRRVTVVRDRDTTVEVELLGAHLDEFDLGLR